MDGNLRNKKTRQLHFTSITINLYLVLSFVNILQHNAVFPPVKHTVVLQILCSPASLHVFNDVVLQKLLQELNGLLPGDVRAKVAVALKQLVQPVYRGRGSEAGSVMPEVLAVLPEGHAGPEQTRHLVPLEENKS